MIYNGITLSSPWITLYREIKAIFSEDPDIEVEYDEDRMEINLFVNNQDKAKAICTILPTYRSFGNITVFINVIPSNDEEDGSYVLREEKVTFRTFERAFDGNPAFAYLYRADKLPINYIVFKNCVVQYFNDALNDAYGICSTLYQEIAKDIFGQHEGIYFCTDIGNAAMGMPLGEWP